MKALQKKKINKLYAILDKEINVLNFFFLVDFTKDSSIIYFNLTDYMALRLCNQKNKLP